LLSDSLSGDSKTLMFVNLSPVAASADESVCSLNFASRVRNVELGKASKHVVRAEVPAPEE
jgi:kinesin family protein C2/C3